MNPKAAMMMKVLSELKGHASQWKKEALMRRHPKLSPEGPDSIDDPEPPVMDGEETLAGDEPVDGKPALTVVVGGAEPKDKHAEELDKLKAALAAME